MESIREIYKIGHGLRLEALDETNIVIKDWTLSGAEVGCQGEVGSACAMASGAVTQLFGGSINQIEQAASIGTDRS